MERLNTHHQTSPRNTPKYTPEVREGMMIPAHTHKHTYKHSQYEKQRQQEKKVTRTKLKTLKLPYAGMFTAAVFVPASPSSKVTTTFPAVFMIADSSSFTPDANTNSFWTNCGGSVLTGSVVSSELSKDEPSVSLPSSDSVSEVSTSCQIHETLKLISLCILDSMQSCNWLPQG